MYGRYREAHDRCETDREIHHNIDQNAKVEHHETQITGGARHETTGDDGTTIDPALSSSEPQNASDSSGI